MRTTRLPIVPECGVGGVVGQRPFLPGGGGGSVQGGGGPVQGMVGQ